MYMKRLISILIFVFYSIKNLYLPNLRKLASKKLQLNARIWEKGSAYTNQRTKITGKGVVKIGSFCSFGYSLGGYHYKGQIELQPRYEESSIEIGNRVRTNNNVFICSKKRISIGDDCLIGHNVEFCDFDGHNVPPTKRNDGDG